MFYLSFHSFRDARFILLCTMRSLLVFQALPLILFTSQRIHVLFISTFLSLSAFLSLLLAFVSFSWQCKISLMSDLFPSSFHPLTIILPPHRISKFHYFKVVFSPSFHSLGTTRFPLWTIRSFPPRVPSSSSQYSSLRTEFISCSFPRSLLRSPVLQDSSFPCSYASPLSALGHERAARAGRVCG